MSKGLSNRVGGIASKLFLLFGIFVTEFVTHAEHLHGAVAQLLAQLRAA